MNNVELAIRVRPCGEEVGRAWKGASGKQRRAIFWDAPFEEREELFRREMAERFSFICYENGLPVCASWTDDGQGGMAPIHFFACGKGRYLLPFGQAAMAIYARQYKGVTCFVPRLFYGCRALLEMLSFLRGPTFYKVGEVNGRKRDIVMYWRDFQLSGGGSSIGIKIHE